ncbi:MAG TPA: ATP-binding protein [Solirubrobacterales bacterium]|nr:ATP-binding protein [Solirubrobacterales bacterium]
MRKAWGKIGLRGKMAVSIGIIVLVALGLVLLGVRREVGEAIGAVLLGGTIGLVAVLVASHLLDEAFSRQRQFVSDASHELRTPLTAIRGQLEVLARRERPETAEVRRVTDVALAEMVRIERLVEDLLTLARLDEEPQLRPVEIPLEPFLHRFGEDPSLGEVALGELPAGTLRADPDGLTQVIRNLLANARRHAGSAGRVELSAAATGERLTIRVDDDGPGVPPRERERVFDRFHRSEAARDRGSGGSGLGLAIARSIVEQHEGRIWIESSPLGGARVAFEIPGFQSQ